jgi:putative FmdB family regulatory protein
VPIYEYVCPECGHPFEKRVTFSQADEPQPCPACGHERADKQISLVAHQSTGTGSASYSSGAACGPVG